MITRADQTVFDDDLNDKAEETTKTNSERPVLIVLDSRSGTGTGTGGAGGARPDNRRYSIDKREMVFGRDITCDIVVDDNRASRRHARLIYDNYDHPLDPPEIFLYDAKSTNGIFVNGVRVTEHRLHNRDKILIGSTVLGFFLRDQWEMEADERLYQLANHDALTGLSNRGVFNVEILREFERARRYQRHLALVMFDIDHFKRFNDTYGHQMGDYVLQEISRIARANIRSNDVAARYGGEEFALILPETTLEGALIQAERLRMAINLNPFSMEQTSVNISASMGIASYEDTMRSVDDMIKSADMALYHAKTQGRNCVCWIKNGRLSDPSATQPITKH